MLFAGDVPSDCCATGTADARELSCWDWARSGIAKHDAVNNRKRLTIEYLLPIRRDAVDPLQREQVDGKRCFGQRIHMRLCHYKRNRERHYHTRKSYRRDGCSVPYPSVWSPRESSYCYSRLVNFSELAPLARWARQWPEAGKTGREERESVKDEGIRRLGNWIKDQNRG